MATSKLGRYWLALTVLWLALTVLLVVVIVISGWVIWLKYGPGQPLEISLAPSQQLQGEISVTGAVANPGIYPLRAGDSLEEVIRDVGGTTTNADLGQIRLYIPEQGEKTTSQKININQAEAWLLEALPGIGETLAQRIIDYRQLKGLFKNTNELTRVEGIGPSIYEQIKDLITVTD